MVIFFNQDGGQKRSNILCNEKVHPFFHTKLCSHLFFDFFFIHTMHNKFSNF